MSQARLVESPSDFPSSQTRSVSQSAIGNNKQQNNVDMERQSPKKSAINQPIPWPRSRPDVGAAAKWLLILGAGMLIGYLAQVSSGLGYALGNSAPEIVIYAGIWIATYALAHQFGKAINLRSNRAGWDHVYANVENVQNTIEQIQAPTPVVSKTLISSSEESGLTLEESQRQTLYDFCNIFLRTANPRSSSGKRMVIQVWGGKE